MAELSTGTVTFLLTDFAGSTRVWEAHPEAALPRQATIIDAQGGLSDGARDLSLKAATGNPW